MIILGGIYSGTFTATEAAVIAVFYSVLVSMFIYKEMSWKELAGVFLESGIASAAILLIISIAAVFGVILSKQHVPQMLAHAFTAIAPNKYIFLLLVNILLLIIGMFMENSSSIIIMTPLLAPIAASYGVNLTHFGCIVVCNLAIGMVTPPFGLCLFTGNDLAQAKLGDTIRSLIPYLAVSMIALALVTYIPDISMGLVKLIAS